MKLGYFALLLLNISAQVMSTPVVSQQQSIEGSSLHKVKFDISDINDMGLTGPVGGQRSVSYEFCIPQTDEALNQVLNIDSSIQHYMSGRGRINCLSNQQLCIADTYGEDRRPWEWKEILKHLCELCFIDSFELNLGE